MVLTKEEVEASLQDSDGWKADDGIWMAKDYNFHSFQRAISFINEIARLAEDRQHHPYLTIDHTKVNIKLSTLDWNGLTQKDFESAYAYDQTYQKFS